MLEAKVISKLYKFIAPAFVVAMSLLYWLGIFKNGSVNEFIKVGCFIYGSGAGTIDLNLLFEKLALIGKEHSNG